MNSHHHGRAKTRRAGAGAGVRARDGGFSLVEIIVVLAIIALLSSIAVVAVSRGLRGGRDAGERQFLTSLKIASEQFKQKFGFNVPVLDDPMGPMTGTQPDATPRLRDLLREAQDPIPDFNDSFSTNSLGYYLIGAGDKDIDGVDGPGYTLPNTERPTERRGVFSKRGQTYEALIDVSRDRTRLRVGTGNVGPTFEVLDRWGRAIRYYGWEPSFYDAANPPPDPGRKGQIRLYNIPTVVWQAAVAAAAGTAEVQRIAALGSEAERVARAAELVPELRSTRYAVISAGDDGVFGINPNPLRDQPVVDDLVELIK